MQSALVLLCLYVAHYSVLARETPTEIRAKLHEMTTSGRMNDIISYLDSVERTYGTLVIDEVMPSLYSYKGVALYNGLRVQEAEQQFRTAVKHFPNETRSWINLGELQVQTFKLADAFESFNAALKAGDMAGLPRAIRTKGWSASWEYIEGLAASMEHETQACVEGLENCRIDSAGGMEYCDVDSRAHVLMNALNPNSQVAPVQIPTHSKAQLWRTESAESTLQLQFSAPARSGMVGAAKQLQLSSSAQSRRLKVGFMSSDFGVHPVAQLVRGLFQFINTSRVEVFCFALHPKVSWWGQNISETVEHFVWLQGMNTLDAAREIARLGVEVLIDLNGHTMHSGLPIMTHQPAALQMSFLGLPTTTAAPFIDYYLADSVAVPPEQRGHYSEQLALLADCYIANDYAQVQGDVLKFSGTHRAPRSALTSPIDLAHSTFLFGTLSNSQKMDPAIFQVWMNILRRFPGSHMIFVEHAGSSVYIPNLQQNGRGFGIDATRLVGLKQAPWIDHLYGKTTFDLMLDTVTKNGHTTGLDGVWAGVPTLSLAGGKEAPARAAESIAVSLESQLGLGYSLKEYEDMAFALARQMRSKTKRGQKAPAKKAESDRTATGPEPGPSAVKGGAAAEGPGERRLRLWRQQLGTQRTASNLFDMPRYEQQFTRLLQGTWELTHLARSTTAFQRSGTGQESGDREATATRTSQNLLGRHYNPKKLFHIFTPVSSRQGARDDFLGEHGAEAKAVEAAAQRLSNRDEHGHIHVFQSQSEGSAINAAVRALSGFTETAHPDDTELMPTAEQRDQWEGSSRPPTARSGAGSPAGYHQTGKGAAGRDGPGENTRRFPSIPRFVFDGRLIMLNIGGIQPVEGWLTVNSQASSAMMQDYTVDIVREMHDLYGLDDNSVSAIYSSHTLEHNSFGDKALEYTLAEWYRVLRPGGLLLVSVPDLETLARMLLDPGFGLEDQWMVTRMMYGAQSDAFDYHMVGFTYKVLHAFLQQAGFCRIERLRSFNMFKDTSELLYKGYFVSLNVAARVCPGGDGSKLDDGFSVDHQGTPWEQ